jgi:hypothetical protein
MTNETKTAETLRAEWLAADAAWNAAVARFDALGAARLNCHDQAEYSRLEVLHKAAFAEKKTARAAYDAACDAYEAAGGTIE